MTYPLDIVFVDRDWRVVRVARLQPFGLRICVRANAVLELRAGEATRLGISVGTLITEL